MLCVWGGMPASSRHRCMLPLIAVLLKLLLVQPHQSMRPLSVRAMTLSFVLQQGQRGAGQGQGRGKGGSEACRQTRGLEASCSKWPAVQA